jgi:hypothetical protein
MADVNADCTYLRASNNLREENLWSRTLSEEFCLSESELILRSAAS